MTLSGKFISPNDPSVFVFASWMENGKNAKLYFDGKLIFESDNATLLKEGTSLSIEQLGKVEVSIERGNLLITVNGTPFQAKANNNRFDFAGLSRIFWILSGFSLFVHTIQLVTTGNIIAHSPPAMISFIIDVLCTLSYVVAAVFINRKVFWIYFPGAAIFTIMTLILLLNLEAILGNYLAIIIIMVRLGLLFFVLRAVPDILKAMRQKKEASNNEVLDQI